MSPSRRIHTVTACGLALALHCASPSLALAETVDAKTTAPKTDKPEEEVPEKENPTSPDDAPDTKQPASEPVAKAAATEEQKQRAKEIFMAGVQAYRAGDLLTAAQAFEQAYAVEPRPGFVFSRGQAYRQHYFASRDKTALTAAIAAYQSYLKLVPKGGRRTDAARALGDLVPLARDLDPDAATGAKKTQTRVWISARPKGATVSIDGGPERKLPLRQAVKPGKHRIVLRATGHEELSRDIVALEGELLPLDMSLKALPAQLRLEGQHGVEVRIGGEEVAALPLTQALSLKAGSYDLVFSRNGHVPTLRHIELSAGKQDTLEVSLATTTQRKWTYGVLTTGGASVIAGGVLAGFTLSAQNDAQSVADTLSSTGMIAESDRQAHNVAIERRDELRRAATAVFAGGAALLSLGTLLYLFDEPSNDLDPKKATESSAPPEGKDDAPEVDLLAGGVPGAPMFMMRLRF